ncbi:unnamed protein product, partial [Hymenolepis diminuta]
KGQKEGSCIFAYPRTHKSSIKINSRKCFGQCTIFHLNQSSFSVLNDRHWWMINASNPRKSFLLDLFLPQMG